MSGFNRVRSLGHTDSQGASTIAISDSHDYYDATNYPTPTASSTHAPRDNEDVVHDDDDATEDPIPTAASPHEPRDNAEVAGLTPTTHKQGFADPVEE